MSGDEIRVRCVALTQTGQQCKNYARSESTYCYTHRKYAGTDYAGPIKTSATAGTPDLERMQELIDELDDVVTGLKQSFPDEATSSPYNPLRLATMLRDNLSKLPPDIQVDILENFEGMSREDLMDIETWKGVAYMTTYSAKFQAGQVVGKVDSRLPEPLQSGSVLSLFKRTFDRFMPEIGKDILNNFEGATPEDFLDPDTWKGLWYMLDYSLRFQADQLKQRVLGDEDAPDENDI